MLTISEEAKKAIDSGTATVTIAPDDDGALVLSVNGSKVYKDGQQGFSLYTNCAAVLVAIANE